MRFKRASAVAASAVLLGGLAAAACGPATAATSATTSATAACTIEVGSITGAGDIATTAITASSPITAKRTTGPHLFAPGAAKIASTWTTTLGVGGEDTTYGDVILNSTLYSGFFGHDSTGKPTSGLKAQGGGYNGYKAIDTSFYGGRTVRGAQYRLRGDGVLYRYNPDTRESSRYTGYSAVKTMALISETATYDTFLATTNGGALYTIHIPANIKQAPVVKKIRTSTWQGFEYLVAEKCGAQGTLLAAIDKESGSAYLYAVGHANGTATVIKGLGKVPGSFTDLVYYLHTGEGNPPLFGE
ncbi:hypothetical protein [Kribbella sp. NPDC004875]|uniref:hypothetical protein n=1 Tax=Kribbella sp. NPDC004875 TaxID=3364107 RepID=UPI0036903572